MNVQPIVIVVAPQGAGKTRAAEALARRFGCSRIVDEWDGLSELSPGDLALTNAPLGALWFGVDVQADVVVEGEFRRYIDVEDQRRVAEFFNSPEGEALFFEILRRRPEKVLEATQGTPARDGGLARGQITVSLKEGGEVRVLAAICNATPAEIASALVGGLEAAVRTGCGKRERGPRDE